MKKGILTLVALCLTVVQLYGQYCKVIQDVKLADDYKSYFWGVHYSASQKYLVVNQGIMGTYLMDTSFNVIHDYETRNPALGGGNGKLTAGEVGFMGVTRNNVRMNATADTALIWNIQSHDTTQVICQQFAKYWPFPNERKVLFAHYGMLWLYDIESRQMTKLDLTLPNAQATRSTPVCAFIQNGSQLLMFSKKQGLELYDTKTWTRVRQVHDIAKISTITTNFGAGHYYYKSDQTVFIRDLESHRLLNTVDLGDDYLNHVSVSADRSFLIYINKHGVSYYDIASATSTMLLEATDYLDYSGLCLLPQETGFVTGVNGNRLFKCSLSQTGAMEGSVTQVEPFTYSIEEAEKSDNKILKMELALLKLGYKIPLDGMVNPADRDFHAKFCEDKGFPYIFSKDAQKFLGLE